MKQGEYNNLLSTGIIEGPPPNKLITLIKRGFYLLSHPKKWSLWIRTFLLDYRFGRKYLGVRINNGSLEKGHWGTSSTTYFDLECMFSQLSIRDEDIIIDIGCGKGRVFNFFLNKKIKNKMIGIEVDPEVAKDTQLRLQHYKQIEIISGAFEDNPEILLKGTFFYLCNPFSESGIKKFSDMLAKIIENEEYKHALLPVILYYNCHFLTVFEGNPFWNVKKLASPFLTAIITVR